MPLTEGGLRWAQGMVGPPPMLLVGLSLEEGEPPDRWRSPVELGYQPTATVGWALTRGLARVAWRPWRGRPWVQLARRGPVRVDRPGWPNPTAPVWRPRWAGVFLPATGELLGWVRLEPDVGIGPGEGVQVQDVTMRGWVG